ncbi:hypothetical protein C7974DRAFT_201681 [Boeremia exigua]|uniref:uncharacterized protein n=1 Tax=Boeremia exigua TaxID=749465 RepID=UPI001E8DDB9C|nr:uncharacterized protein C7974DRAFT_201681 [Boeremia exigua]KAH6625447.1 hypothetical protein C7974DRAFT_201681 [Boeremia exigua]
MRYSSDAAGAFSTAVRFTSFFPLSALCTWVQQPTPLVLFALLLSIIEPVSSIILHHLHRRSRSSAVHHTTPHSAYSHYSRPSHLRSRFHESLPCNSRNPSAPSCIISHRQPGA